MKGLPDEVGISINRLSQPALLRFRSFRGWQARLELMCVRELFSSKVWFHKKS